MALTGSHDVAHLKEILWKYKDWKQQTRFYWVCSWDNGRCDALPRVFSWRGSCYLFHSSWRLQHRQKHSRHSNTFVYRYNRSPVHMYSVHPRNSGDTSCPQKDSYHSSCLEIRNPLTAWSINEWCCSYLSRSMAKQTSSPKGNDRSPESNVPRSNLISKNSNSSKL